MNTKSDFDGLQAGVAKVDITNKKIGKSNDPLYVKALALKNNSLEVVIITVDAVAIAEIGTIRDNYLGQVREQLRTEFQINPLNVLISASHCHGVVSEDILKLTVQAVREAYQNLTPIRIAVCKGHEDRIMENRRLKLKNGKEADIRRAYSIPPDKEIADIGPVDTEIGILRLDKIDGHTLAVVYNFACHPIMGVAGSQNADITGFASSVIENNLNDGTIALFLQGCAGDINPILYKDVHHPHDAEPLGNMLGLSVLKALRKAEFREEDGTLKVINEIIELPRADLIQTIQELQEEQAKLLQSLKGTDLNIKTFLSLVVKYSLSNEYPSYDSHCYLRDKKTGRNDWNILDEDNRQKIEAYMENIYTMEQMTRNQVNLGLLKMHYEQNMAAKSKTIQVEIMGLRIGEFVIVTFPGELSVQIGLNIKQISPYEFTFISTCTNGYIYYAPTTEQLKNRGRAQEDSDCLLAPEWQQIYEKKVNDIINRIL